MILAILLLLVVLIGEIGWLIIRSKGGLDDVRAEIASLTIGTERLLQDVRAMHQKSTRGPAR